MSRSLRMHAPSVVAIALIATAMSSSPIFAADCTGAITRLLIKHWDVKKAKVVPQAELDRDLGADELDRIEIVMAMELAFGIVVSDEDEKAFRTVGDLVTYANTRAKKGCR